MPLAFHPIISESSSTDFLITTDDNKNADTTTTSYVYYKQPDYLQIIQLVECPAPPPPQISDHIPDAPSSYYDSTECSSSEDDDEELEQDEDEELCSSYCSSDEEELECPPESSEAFVRPLFSPESDDIRMKRILAWRENFSAAMSATLSDPTTTTTTTTATAMSLKRKSPGDYRGDDHDEIMSHSSKRSRLSDDESSSVSSFGEQHSCPACDATFPTRQSLRQHGLDAAKSNEACSVAVQYAFE